MRRLSQGGELSNQQISFSFREVNRERAHGHSDNHANDPSPTCYLSPSQSALLNRSLFDVLFN